ncbi:MAG: hypothetical protein PWQ77_589 [Kosmotogales bacterium]|nr:hypothetical protein [Kosmotogales bacterium]
MKKIYILSTFLMIFLLLTGCIQKNYDLNTGYRYLKEGKLDLSGKIFEFIINNSSNTMDVSLSHRGLGWVHFLQNNFATSLMHFRNCDDSSETYIGIILNYIRIDNTEEAINMSREIEMEVFPIEYLPDPLTKEEFCKLISVLCIYENKMDAFYYFIEYISDTEFLLELTDFLR